MKKKEVWSNLFLNSRKGQVTIFIILGIVIVAAVALIYFLYPQIKSVIGIGTSNPDQFMQSCMQDKIISIINNLSLQGGSLSPNDYFLYNGNRVEYLCYTNINYQACIMQQPFLQNYIESEIATNL